VRRITQLNWVYQNYIRFGQRYRRAFILLLILGFGLPIDWLPQEIEKKSYAAKLYNQSLGSEWFQNDVKPLLSKLVGGSLRLFSNFVYESSFYQEPTETKLYVLGNMPEGCTVHQLNESIEKMENFISQFDEVDIFKTTINNYNDSRIEIHFKAEHERSNFPYFLKSQLETKAIGLGGMDWSVYGVGRGFSNALHTGFKSSRIILRGYNYEQLYRYAEHLREKLLQSPRIKEIDITGSSGWRTITLHEYFLDFDQQQLALNNLQHNYLYGYLYNIMQRNSLSPVYLNNEMHPVTLYSDKYQQFNVWQLENEMVKIDTVILKLDRFLQMEKRKTGNDIHKENQQYQLVVAYNFIGPGRLAQKVEQEHIEYMNGFLPMGYKASPRFWSGWQKDDKSQYYLLLVVILIIYFICSILLESFKQPLAIISLIPFAYVGVFLTFYLLDINFDQGGFAAFILLSGLVVNAGLYIINDFNNFKRKHISSIRLYIKAYNHKIIPILLTIISTMLGLLPFIWGGQKDVFWFAFAAGAIGGLVFSLLAIVFYLPVLMKIKD
jgi:multidrug efflux pump subunit AcrB